ncbi:hypothetical protein ACS2QM_09185, partial [Bacillus cereus group sp. Bce035]
MRNLSLTYYLGSKTCITLADIVYVMIITTHIYIATKSATMNCTPIVRHSLTIGGAVFLWLNLQL